MSQNKSDLSTFLPRRISPPFFLQKYIRSNFAMMNHLKKLWTCALYEKENHFDHRTKT